MSAKRLIVWVPVALVAAVGLVLLFAPAGGPGVEEVSPGRIAQLIGEGVRVIDVRTPGEFDTSHLPGAENVPMNTLAQEASAWDRSEPVIIYCTTGARSSSAVRLLADQGFEQVYHFTDGIIAWEGELERGVEVAEMPPDVAPSGTPVMYEFFTDW